jgi:hypothetical protein
MTGVKEAEEDGMLTRALRMGYVAINDASAGTKVRC